VDDRGEVGCGGEVDLARDVDPAYGGMLHLDR
jgi:hypothetical protein